MKRRTFKLCHRRHIA